MTATLALLDYTSADEAHAAHRQHDHRRCAARPGAGGRSRARRDRLAGARRRSAGGPPPGGSSGARAGPAAGRQMRHRDRGRGRRRSGPAPGAWPAATASWWRPPGGSLPPPRSDGDPAQPGGAGRPAAPAGLDDRQRPGELAGRDGRPWLPPCLTPGPPGSRRQTAGTARRAPWPAAQREQKLAALRERLLAEAGTIRTAGDWERCLRAAARLPGEGFANILLVEAQRPGATMLRGYEAWRAAGRQVNRGEPGIEVLSAVPPGHPANAGRPPARGSGAGDPGWRDASRVAYVWDVSQTSGPPAAVPSSRSGPAGRGPCGAVGRAVLAGPPRGVRGRARAGRSRRRRHLLDSAPHPRPARAERRAGSLGAGAPARPRAGARRSCATRPARRPPVSLHRACARPRPTPSPSSPAPVTASRCPACLADPAAWAGTDPRAQPAATILAAGRAGRHGRQPDHRPSRAGPAPVPPPPPSSPAPSLPGHRSPRRRQPAPHRTMPLARAPVPGCRTSWTRRRGGFYRGQLAGSWAEGYLRSRGIGTDHGPAVGHRVRACRVDRAHRPPAGRRVRRGGDRGGRARPPVLARNAHRPLPRPGRAACPRPRRPGRRVHRPGPPGRRPRCPEVPQQPRDQPVQEGRACCSASMRRATRCWPAPCPCSSRARSTRSRSPSRAPGAWRGWLPAGPR